MSRVRLACGHHVTASGRVLWAVCPRCWLALPVVGATAAITSE